MNKNEILTVMPDGATHYGVFSEEFYKQGSDGTWRQYDFADGAWRYAEPEQRAPLKIIAFMPEDLLDAVADFTSYTEYYLASKGSHFTHERWTAARKAMGLPIYEAD